MKFYFGNMKLRYLIRHIGFCLIALLTYPLQAQKLHFIVFADTDDPVVGLPGLNTYNYLTHDLAPAIAKEAGLTLSLSGFKSTNCRLENLNSTLAALKPDADDVIFFYFTGHGWNNRQNEYPSILFPPNLSRSMIEANSMNLYDLYQKLRSYNARMTVVIGEAGNRALTNIANKPASDNKADSFRLVGPANPVEMMPATLYDKQRLQQLFRATRGGFLLSGCKPGQLSYASETGGWLSLSWQNVFLKILSDDKKLAGEPTNWTTLINQVVNETQKTARENKVVQSPQFVNELVPCPTCLKKANAGKRYALVIGNDNYRFSPKLNGQPLNDAQDVAKRLQTMGFTVSSVLNGNRQQMLDQIDELVTKAERADLLMLYYSGHGVQDDHENYLVPVDARFITKSDITNRAISLEGLIAKLGSARARFNIIALDACRGNTVTIEQSDTREEIPKGFKTIAGNKLIESVYISLASRSGKPAYSNPANRNGYFTEALLKHLENGKRIESIFRLVSAEVETMTNQRQQPEIIDRLKGDLIF